MIPVCSVCSCTFDNVPERIYSMCEECYNLHHYLSGLMGDRERLQVLMRISTIIINARLDERDLALDAEQERNEL